MSSQWQKVFIRRDSDVPTICGMILTAYKYIWQYKKDKKEYLFGYSEGGHYHYFDHNFDKWGFGRSLYKKHFYTPSDIFHYYRMGMKFLAKTKAKTARWKKLVTKNPTKHLLTAYQDFRTDFEFVNNNYSIMPWWATEAWQHDFEEILSRLVAKNNLTSQYDRIIQSATKPWKTTAINHIQKDYKNGATIPDLVKKYQFLRSWTAI